MMASMPSLRILLLENALRKNSILFPTIHISSETLPMLRDFRKPETY